MARYTGPKTKLCRRVGFTVVRNSNAAKAFSRRETIGDTRRPKKVSEYGARLLEKQKIRYHYGLSEKQLLRLFKTAQRMPGNSGHNLLVLLERRLDNVVLNLRWAITAADSRQLVSHGHIAVNGRRLDVPSYLVEEGDVVSVIKKKRSEGRVRSAFAQISDAGVPEWLVSDDNELTGRIARFPTREEARCPVEENKVIEYYSR